VDIEKLVDMVTREVMMKIQSGINDTTIDKEKVLVISSCEEEITMIKNLLEGKYEVCIYDKLDINMKNYEYIIVTNLCNKGLSSMALGLCNDNVQEFIIESLFNCKNVYVLKEGIEYRKYSTNANKELYNLYNQYECKIMSYGVVLVSGAELLKRMEDGTTYNEKVVQVISEKKSTNDIQNHQVTEISNKRLITESDLKKLYMNGLKEVTIIRKAIITPLAQDYVRIKQLKLSRV
jgi:ethanolamine utilization protein